MDKLTLEHLAPYLPYKLRAYVKFDGIDLFSYIDCSNVIGFVNGDTKRKPLFRPLSDYTDINSPSMNDLNTDLGTQMEICDLANKKIHYRSLSYGTALTCFQAHIDVLGLIDKGLAIDINTVEK